MSENNDKKVKLECKSGKKSDDSFRKPIEPADSSGADQSKKTETQDSDIPPSAQPDLSKLEGSILQANDRTTRATLFSIGAFMVSLYAVYLMAVLDDKTDGIYSEAKSMITAIGPISLEKNEEGKLADRDIYPTDQRVMSIASTLLLRGVSLEESRQYLEDVEVEVALDSREQYFFKTIAAYGSPLSMVQRTGDKQVTLFNKWKIDFQSEDAFLLQQFPMNPTLVMNHESVAFPECVEGAEPYISYAKATLEGETWEAEPSVLQDDKLGRWIFTYNDIDPLDTKAFARRVLAVPNCRLIEDKETKAE